MLTAPLSALQPLQQAHTPHTWLVAPIPHPQHPSHTPAPIPHSWNTCQALTAHPRIAPSVPGSQHPFPAHSTPGRLTAPIPRPQHPSHTHTHSTYPTNSTHARLTGPLPSLYQLYHSSRAILVAPMAASQHPHQSHNPHTGPRTPTPIPQHPHESHSPTPAPWHCHTPAPALRCHPRVVAPKKRHHRVLSHQQFLSVAPESWLVSPTLTPCAGLGHLVPHLGPLPGGPNLCKGVTSQRSSASPSSGAKGQR